MDLLGCLIGDGTVYIIRWVAIHQGLVQVFVLQAIEQREYAMGFVEVIIDCSVISTSALNIGGLQHAAYQC